MFAFLMIIEDEILRMIDYEEQQEAIPRRAIHRRCMAPDEIRATLDADEIRERCDTSIAPV